MKQRVLLVGSDGHDLLNRISTLEISRIPFDSPTLGLLLNPQGKIRASFVITRRSDTESEIAFEPPFLEVLDQFTFAEKYELRPLPHASATGRPEAERIAALTPALGHEYRHDESTNPLEVNLRPQIHEGKGCYPGQEVIEKIISLGSPARKLALLELDPASQPPVAPALPLPLLDEKTLQEVGTLTSFDGHHALGILRRTHLQEGKRLLLPQKTGFIVKRISE